MIDIYSFNKQKKTCFLLLVKTQALSTIRILGRDPVGSNALFTKEVTYV